MSNLILEDYGKGFRKKKIIYVVLKMGECVKIFNLYFREGFKVEKT